MQTIQISQRIQAWVDPDNLQELLELLQLQKRNHYCWALTSYFWLHSVIANMRLSRSPQYNSPRTDGNITVPVTISVV